MNITVTMNQEGSIVNVERENWGSRQFLVLGEFNELLAVTYVLKTYF